MTPELKELFEFVNCQSLYEKLGVSDLHISIFQDRYNFVEGSEKLTDDFLILSSSPQKKYLVEINGFCDELKFAQALILNRSIASSLQTRFDSISTPKWPNLKFSIELSNHSNISLWTFFSLCLDTIPYFH